MLIIPLTGKVSWRNPPWVTLSIILINCLVFFGFQIGQNEQFIESETFYYDSGLAKIELPRYETYIHGGADDAFAAEGDYEKVNKNAAILIHQQMEADFDFLKKLHNDEIITLQDPLFAKWKALRKTYDEKRANIPFFKYGFRPAYKSLDTAFTYMFLHGGLAHLLGNMIFLWLVGCVLELGCGRLFYTLAYLMTGFFAVALYGLIYIQSTVPLVGASGAVSGLIGIYTVLYGRKRVNIFYSLGFYFNYAKVPAIILLPIWIVNELFQLFFGGASQVAYVAHIGGLFSGALLAYVNWKYWGMVDERIFDDEPEDKISPLVEEALKHMGELDLEGGRRCLNKALALEPENIEILNHLFNLEKMQPEHHRFHETAKKLLNHLSFSSETDDAAYRIYQDYTGLTTHPQLTPGLCLRLSSVFARQGHVDVSAKMIAVLLNKKPDFPGLPTALLKLANAYRERGMTAHRKRCHQVVCSNYPDSSEARIARRMLEGQSAECACP